jgi:ergothioneine biosynthesis protein EgtB
MNATSNRARRAERSPEPADDLRERWLDAFTTVRAETERRAEPLSPEDQQIQSMADASPTKWHRAHTTWFFEQFLLVPHVPGYKVFDERFAFLFNSYYVAAGPRHARPKRGLITRPTCEEVAAFRAHVDTAIRQLIEAADDRLMHEIIPVLEIGLHHEQQHQELILTDILHAFGQNPTNPAYDSAWKMPRAKSTGEYVPLAAGVHFIGHKGDGFRFDNEEPAHRQLIETVKIARSLVTNREWLEFMQDGGYETTSLWLSDAWATVQSEGWNAPAYWEEKDGSWSAFTLAGLQPVDPEAPVSHISYFEADAFARWAGKHLPTEAEWEVAARQDLLDDAFGLVWQWTRSAYLAYPGYRAPEGALGEYNGKFMVNQMVLRGSSVATPKAHARVTYRNFFYPPHRWQFTGLRLVEYGA